MGAALIEGVPALRCVLSLGRRKIVCRTPDNVVFARYGDQRHFERAVELLCVVSNCAGLAGCVRSPVWTTKAGWCGSALIASIVLRNVPATSGFSGRAKPMWLSLILTNEIPSDPLASAPAVMSPELVSVQTMPGRSNRRARRTPGASLRCALRGSRHHGMKRGILATKGGDASCWSLSGIAVPH